MRLSLSASLFAVLVLAPQTALAQMPHPLPKEALVEEVDPARVAYLRNHIVGSGPIDGPVNLRLPADIYRARLILMGESHGALAPQMLDLQMLTTLNRRVGLTDYLAEIDPVQAERFNHYLTTGAVRPLDRVFAKWTNSAQWGNAAFRDKIVRIRAYNLTVPATKRVRIWGIDAVQDWPLLLEWLTAAGASVDRAEFDAAKTEAARSTLALTWLKTSRGGDATTRAALNAALMQRSVGNRESTIFAGYQHLVSSGALGNRPAYGLWGAFHVLQASVNKAMPFAARVRQSTLPAAKSMATIELVLLDSAVLIPAPLPAGVQMMRMTEFNIDGPLIKIEGSADLRASTQPRTITLFDLDAPASPYRTERDFVSVKTTVGQDFTPDDPAAPATAYARIIGVVRGSDWAPPLKP